jgi:hypothetical protein
MGWMGGSGWMGRKGWTGGRCTEAEVAILPFLPVLPFLPFLPEYLVPGGGLEPPTPRL